MKKLLAALILSTITISYACAIDYPEIRVLSRADLLFVQLENEVESFYRASLEKQPPSLPPLNIFTYKWNPSEDLFTISARLSLPYDSIATLNGIETTAGLEKLDRILIPSQPGIFVSDPPRTELERMILDSRLDGENEPQKLMLWVGGVKCPMLFFPGSALSDMERAYFLCILFRFPIAQGSITSRYGPRANPFSGNPEFHNGLDIGAAEGTEVHAARDGSVADKGTSPVLGNYLIISHPGGYQTVYGHLSAFSVNLGQEVAAGEVIGKVGHTGQATGPHLHFEIRTRGLRTDPFPLLRVKK
jgi:murein DD-endopeptidase MepM/ murein hydrolase activator NlpD